MTDNSMKTDRKLESENLEEEQPKTGKQQQDGTRHEQYRQQISTANNADYSQYYQ